MLSQANSIDLNTRHGNILGCAEVVHALHLWAGQNGRYEEFNNFRVGVKMFCVEGRGVVLGRLH